MAQNLHDDSYTGTTDYSLTYSPTTRIGTKYSHHPALGQPDLLYAYDDSGLTHQTRVIHDRRTHTHMQLYWDANGNLREVKPYDGYPRFHLWDDDDRMIASIGSHTCGYYGNASDGKRAYKVTGLFSLANINGGVVSGTAYFDNTILYPNPYITIMQGGYTKHYFMGAERIGTTIGGGNNGNWLINPVDSLTAIERELNNLLKKSEMYRYAYYDMSMVGYPTPNDNTFNTDITGSVTQNDFGYHLYQYWEKELLYGDISMVFQGNLAGSISHYCHDNCEDIPFYYHSDHLGSAAWITDGQGLPVQYFMYAPYGEPILNQHSRAYYERFTFTGKEKDEETGYYHFDARNYIDAASIWTRTDPLLGKYIYNSPYVYCDGNPIKFVDLDGRKIVVGSWYGRLLAKLGFKTFEATTMSHLQELKDMDSELNEMITKIEESSTEYHINHTNGNSFAYSNQKKEIRYNPNSKETKTGRKRPAQVGLAHELGHAENDVDGTTVEYDADKARHGDKTERDKCNKNEQNSINKENVARKHMGCKERPNDYYTKEEY